MKKLDTIVSVVLGLSLFTVCFLVWGLAGGCDAGDITIKQFVLYSLQLITGFFAEIGIVAVIALITHK